MLFGIIHGINTINLPIPVMVPFLVVMLATAIPLSKGSLPPPSVMPPLTKLTRE